MSASEHTRFCRAARGGFSRSGSRLSAVTVILAAGIAWCSACSTSPYCDEGDDYGICHASAAQVSGVQYGDREPDEGEISARGSYVCAFSYDEVVFSPRIGGGIECLDPAAGIEKWGDKGWGIEFGLSLSSEICACSNAVTSCGMEAKFNFDQAVGIPQSGAVFDLTQAEIVGPDFAGGADYTITGGTVEFVTVDADRYSFKIHDLAFTKTPDDGVEETSDCYIPDTVTIESISIDCVPTVENMYC